MLGKDKIGAIRCGFYSRVRPRGDPVRVLTPVFAKRSGAGAYPRVRFDSAQDGGALGTLATQQKPGRRRTRAVGSGSLTLHGGVRLMCGAAAWITRDLGRQSLPDL